MLSFEIGQLAANGSNAQTYLMGYRGDRPFAEMPKLHIDMKGANTKVYERRRRVPDDSVKVSISPTLSEVRVPLKLLGDPERILLAAHTNAGNVPLDSLPWVALDLTGGR